MPLGRGNKAAVGYCVGISETKPERAVKPLLKILDEQPLLTPVLLKLTRWMAGYYLCSWGHVLDAIVPAGARNAPAPVNAPFFSPSRSTSCRRRSRSSPRVRWKPSISCDKSRDRSKPTSWPSASAAGIRCSLAW